MAIRFDNAADRLLRTSDLLNFNGSYTWMGWIYLVSDTNTNTFFLSGNDGQGLHLDALGTDASGTQTTLGVAVGGTSSNFQGPNLTVGQWYHFAVVRESATSVKMYVNGDLIVTDTRNVGGRPAMSRMEVGGFATMNWFNLQGRVAYMKAWTVGLSAAEVAAEVDYVVPIRTANLYAYWDTPSGSNRHLDASGNGRHWTVLGTLTDEANPPDVEYEPAVPETYDETGFATTIYAAQSGSDSLVPAPLVFNELTPTTLYASVSGTDTLLRTYTEVTPTTTYVSVTGTDTLTHTYTELAPETIAASTSGTDQHEQVETSIQVVNAVIWGADNQNYVYTEVIPTTTYVQTDGTDTVQVFDQTAMTVYAAVSGEDSMALLIVEVEPFTIAAAISGLETETWVDLTAVQHIDAVLDAAEVQYISEYSQEYAATAALSGFDILDVNSEGLLLLGISVNGSEQVELEDYQPTNIWLRSSGLDTFVPGPLLLDYTISFTAQDNTSTIVSYEVWTAAGGTGNLLLTGEAETGVLHTSDTITDEWLEHGENTRYLRVFDVQGNMNEYAFIVNAEIGDTYEDVLTAQVISTLTAGMDTAIFVHTDQIQGVTAPISGEITAEMYEVASLLPITISLDGLVDQIMAETDGVVDAAVMIEGLFGSIWTEDAELQIAAFINAETVTEYAETMTPFSILTNFEGLDVLVAEEFEQLLVETVVSGIDFDPGDADSALILVYSRSQGTDTHEMVDAAPQEIDAVLDASDSMTWAELLTEMLSEVETLGSDVHLMMDVDSQLVAHLELDGIDSDEWYDVLDEVLQVLETDGLDAMQMVDLNPYEIHVAVEGFDAPAFTDTTGQIEIFVRIEGQDRIPLRLYLRFEDTALVQVQPYDGDAMFISDYHGTVQEAPPVSGDIESAQPYGTYITQPALYSGDLELVR